MKFKVTAGVFVLNGRKIPTGTEFYSQIDWSKHKGNVVKESDEDGPDVKAPANHRRAVAPHVAARRALHEQMTQQQPQGPTTYIPAGVPDTGPVEMAPPPQEKPPAPAAKK